MSGKRVLKHVDLRAKLLVGNEIRSEYRFERFVSSMLALISHRPSPVTVGFQLVSQYPRRF